MGRYTNFSDPFGLVGRILREREPAGLQALARAGAGYPVALLDRYLVREEESLLSAAQPSHHPVVLIVGAPRSGTTLLHQLLVSHTDTSFFTNRNALFSRAPLAAARRFDRFPGSAPLSSYYGLSAGNDAPNDAFHIWNRWLGQDRYQPRPNGSAAPAARFFDAWRTVHDKPLVSKNNRNTAAMDWLAASIPGVRFVALRRDPLFVAQSLIEARRQVQGSDERKWGLASVDGQDPVDDVTAQVMAVGDMLDASPPGTIDVQYEKLISDPANTLDYVAGEVGLVPRRLEDVPELNTGNVERLPARVLDGLRERLG